MKKWVGKIVRNMFSYFFHSLLFILTFQRSFKNVTSLATRKTFIGYLTNRLVRTHYYCQALSESIFNLERNANDIVIDTKNMKLSDFKWRSDMLSLDIVTTVANQLGYVPLNIINVGAFRDDNRLAMEIFPLKSDHVIAVNDGQIESPPSVTLTTQHPLVIIVYPLNCNSINRQHKNSKVLKPFPTVIWMTCPELHKRISKLEDAGWISKLQTKLQDSNEYKDKMISAHNLYKQFRWSLLSKDDQEYLNNSGWRPSLNEVGIAGMKNFDSVKCLHTHYAHFLCRPQDGNIIGEWTHELLVQSSLNE